MLKAVWGTKPKDGFEHLHLTLTLFLTIQQSTMFNIIYSISPPPPRLFRNLCLIYDRRLFIENSSTISEEHTLDPDRLPIHPLNLLIMIGSLFNKLEWWHNVLPLCFNRAPLILIGVLCFDLEVNKELFQWGSQEEAKKLNFSEERKSFHVVYIFLYKVKKINWEF